MINDVHVLGLWTSALLYNCLNTIMAESMTPSFNTASASVDSHLITALSVGLPEQIRSPAWLLGFCFQFLFHRHQKQHQNARREREKKLKGCHHKKKIASMALYNINCLSKRALKVKMDLDVSDGEDFALPDVDLNGRDDRDEEVALIKLNRHQASALPLLVTVVIHKRLCTYQKSILFCLLSSLIKCEVGRESLWKLGSSWGRGKRPLSTCLNYPSECVFHLCMATNNTVIFNIPFVTRDWLHPLWNSASLVGFSQAFHACAVKSIIFFPKKNFTAAFSSWRPSGRHSVPPQSA